MTKFQKFQLYFSIVPGLSSAVVFFATIFELKRRRATAKEWLKFMAIFFGFGVLASVWNAFVMTGENPILNLVVFTIIMAFANYLCIRLQMSCESRSETQEKQHINIQKYAFIVGGVMAFIAIVAAVIIVTTSGLEHIEDTNGPENTSLSSISKEEFVSGKDLYTANHCGFSEKGDQTKVSGTSKSRDYDRCSMYSKKFSGIYTLQATQTDANSMTLIVESTINSGNMEIIIVIDGEYYQHVTTGGKQTIALEDVAGKLVLVRMAAESADISVVVEREIA